MSPADQSTVRAFIALGVAPEVNALAERLVAEMSPGVRGLRWVVGHGLHLTLRFLGTTPTSAVPSLEQGLEAVAEGHAPIQTAVEALGVFPERGSPRILWLGLSGSEALSSLQSACERVAVEAGFAPESRPFQPHITLGRFKERAPRPVLPALERLPTMLRRFALVRSELRPSGPIYTPLWDFELR